MAKLSFLGKNVAVLGGSPSGKSMIRALRSLKAKVTGFAFSSDEENQNFVVELTKLGCEAVIGSIAIDALEGFDLIVICPGSGLYLEAFRHAQSKGVPGFSDMELVANHIPAKIIGVTGSSGKSSTAIFIRNILEAQGSSVLLLGGEKETDFGGVLLQAKKYDYIIFEASSTRLKETTAFKPHVAVLLNIFPGHGEQHHGKLVEYAETKAKIYLQQGPEDFLVAEGSAPNIQELMRRKVPCAKVLKFALESQVEGPGVYYREGKIYATDFQGGKTEYPLSKSRARNYPTRIMNLMAAIAAVLPLGVYSGPIQKTIDAVKPLPGRLNISRRLDGVIYIDDSKSSNIGSASWALHSFSRPILWIIGGELGEEARLSRLPNIAGKMMKKVLVVGSQAERLAGYLKGMNNVVAVGSLKKAVELAQQSAEKGDIVLFSPACPPDRYDEESGFRRGDNFRKAVEGLVRGPRMQLKNSGFTRI